MAEHATVRVRFMPFQLYDHLPAGHSNGGVCKDGLFTDLISQARRVSQHHPTLHWPDASAAWAPILTGSCPRA